MWKKVHYLRNIYWNCRLCRVVVHILISLSIPLLAITVAYGCDSIQFTTYLFPSIALSNLASLLLQINSHPQFNPLATYSQFGWKKPTPFTVSQFRCPSKTIGPPDSGPSLLCLAQAKTQVPILVPSERGRRFHHYRMLGTPHDEKMLKQLFQCGLRQ
jgi:hypothetical protein